MNRPRFRLQLRALMVLIALLALAMGTCEFHHSRWAGMSHCMFDWRFVCVTVAFHRDGFMVIVSRPSPTPREVM